MAGNNIITKVGLEVTANTKQAQQSIENLMGSINKLTQNATTIGSSGFKGFTTEINQAAETATQLKYNLQNAFNVDTGKLNMKTFTTNMIQSGQTAESLRISLSKFGLEGQQAFNKLATSVISAEIPMKTMNPLLKSLGTSLMNVAKWQISSTILTGLISSISSAFQYAQDLNESLNNIRIVTGYSTDQMADFACEANKAAQALSTTTTAYTDASLIFYQQGLKGSDVTDRANVVIKMANVTGESAAKVSEQMTAVWNNFKEGSKSLEYYADVMTALGAATASSTDEISQGIEKFAAIGKTVGLSYEYATAALATVTAKTRQSADVVGTAFKTIFARMEQLKLGETLEDGTTLGQYSEALAKVGVNIKDANDNLKDMDTILDETAAKWKTLSQAQQVGLAESVAGVRQYSQFIALMSNWDFMEQNLEVVKNSTGTLQEQADIYAESWQAASKKVKSALEEIWQDLLNDDALVSILNGVAKFVNAIEFIIKGLGGLPGVLSTIAALALQIGNSTGQISQNLANSMMSAWMSSKSGVAYQQKTKQEFVGEISKNNASGVVGENYQRLGKDAQAYYDIINNGKIHLSEASKAELEEWFQKKQAIADASSELQAYIDKESRKNNATLTTWNEKYQPDAPIDLTGIASSEEKFLSYSTSMNINAGATSQFMTGLQSNGSIQAAIGDNTALAEQRDTLISLTQEVQNLWRAYKDGSLTADQLDELTTKTTLLQEESKKFYAALSENASKGSQKTIAQLGAEYQSLAQKISMTESFQKKFANSASIKNLIQRRNLLN